MVALRKESVDRNQNAEPTEQAKAVALRKESVDRNNAVQVVVVIMHASLSARRAWIEIACPLGPQAIYPVALRKESVDRNTQRRDFKRLGLRRSPQGERG